MTECREASVEGRGARRGFTLVEMLVVVAIIAVLAGMIIPITGALKKVRIRARAKAELAEVQLAIEAYKTKLGHYPPDNPAIPAQNQLYYELKGTTNDGTYFRTLDGSAWLTKNDLQNLFNTDGIVNCSRGGGDEVEPAVNFLKGLRSDKFLACSTPSCAVLGSSVEGPLMYSGASGKINPWRYDLSSPTNNPNSYDLWIDVLVGNQTNRISNWSRQPLVVGP